MANHAQCLQDFGIIRRLEQSLAVYPFGSCIILGFLQLGRLSKKTVGSLWTGLSGAWTRSKAHEQDHDRERGSGPGAPSPRAGKGIQDHCGLSSVLMPVNSRKPFNLLVFFSLSWAYSFSKICICSRDLAGCLSFR